MLLLNTLKNVFPVLRDERGSMDKMVWVLGSAVVVVLVVIILMTNSQTLAGTWWTAITGYIEKNLGF